MRGPHLRGSEPLLEMSQYQTPTPDPVFLLTIASPVLPHRALVLPAMRGSPVMHLPRDLPTAASLRLHINDPLQAALPPRVLPVRLAVTPHRHTATHHTVNLRLAADASPVLHDIALHLPSPLVPAAALAAPTPTITPPQAKAHAGLLPQPHAGPTATTQARLPSAAATTALQPPTLVRNVLVQALEVAGA